MKMQVLSHRISVAIFLFVWLVSLSCVFAIEPGSTSVVMHEWTEQLSINGHTLYLTGRQMFDSTSGTEYTEFFNEQNVRLPVALVEKYQKQWLGVPSCSVPSVTRPDDGSSLKKRNVDILYPDEPGPCIVLPPLSPDALPGPDVDLMKDGTLIGLRRNLPSVVDFKDGLLLPDGRGGFVWKLTIRAEEAKGIRLHLINARFPAGCSFLVYDSANPAQVVGPYTEASLYDTAELWTETIFASSVTLECNFPTLDAGRKIQFEIDEIVHQFVDIQRMMRRKVGTCHKDVTCYPDWATQARAVAGMGTVGEAGELWCTGCLLNDSDTSTFINYFMTAHHCVANQTAANSVEFYWFYQTSTCNGAPPSPSSVPRTSGGADFLAGNSDASGSDFALLRLRANPPSQVTYVGWTTDQPDSTETLTGIHHPDGSYKRISFGNLASSTLNWWSVRWFAGVTEPGSSGSPLFDANHEFIGQLNSGYSSCANQSGLDDYGRFDAAYPIVKTWLGSGSVDPVPKGTWYISDISTEIGHGGTPISGDFDGDDKCDYGIYEAASGMWYLRKSQSGTWSTQFGFANTVPVTADFDGDGLCDYGCYHAASGMWYIMRSRDGYWQTQFGFGGTTPVTGDFDGDGYLDYGCYHAASGMWYINKSDDGYWSTQFGFGGTTPVTADFDGDGKTDYGCYYPPAGMWYVQKSLDGYWSTQFGFADTVPLTADFDGDAKADYGCYYANSGSWYINASTDGFVQKAFGFTGTVPMPGHYLSNKEIDFACCYIGQ